MIRLLIKFVLILSTTNLAFTQETFPVNGVADERTDAYIFKDATITSEAGLNPFKGNILIEKGKISQVSATPIEYLGAIEIDCQGKFIYPSFIDLHSDYGIPEVEEKEYSRGPQFLSNKEGAYGWNEALKPEFDASEKFTIDDDLAWDYRYAGFGTVLSHQMDGLSRGSGVVVSLANNNEQLVMLKTNASHHLSFSNGSSTQDFPGSLMGRIALLRQTYLDGQWYSKQKKEKNLSLEAWNSLLELPTFFDAGDNLNMLRADKIGDEFSKQYVLIGSGEEYKRTDLIKSTDATIIVPLNFPEPLDVEDPLDAQRADFAQLKNWELAPYNLKFISEKNIPHCITLADTENKSDFLYFLRLAVQNGYPESEALKALTTTPAKLIGIDDLVGSISVGKLANFIVCDTNVFVEDAIIYDNWIQGQQYILEDDALPSIDANYLFNFGDRTYEVSIDEEEDNLIHYNDTSDVILHIVREKKMITMNFQLPEFDLQAGFVSMSGWLGGDGYKGIGNWPNGDDLKWELTKKTESSTIETEMDQDSLYAQEEEIEEEEEEEEEIGSIVYPFSPYGWSDKPTSQAVLLKNATLWTNEDEGILSNTDILIENGKIAKIGKDLKAKNALEIDATEKHITSGIIDEHSHIAISGGVNESAQTSSAEVSIADVVNSENIHIYRQLAGGVTAAQLLHGSANPIGGQSALIKLRWGLSPEEMKIKGADGFIKFALGENVKQSNFGYDYRERFPQTRMGVEQAFVDHFTRAKEYDAKVNKRKDLELEALSEILNGERFISCHSYVQSEINMLMKVAEQFGFRINTFTHILEGYKVADIIAKHGAGGSTFSDWWAYKYEVIDAIPYNAKIMHDQGIVVAINSDDAEMARRLNQEAAKSVKYGGMKEEDAWKMVTLNPAKLLHLDDRMGSLKVGKDADIVLWSEHPLSVYAKVEQTYIDGVKYYDKDEDEKLRVEIKKERARIIQKMIAAKKNGVQVIPVEVVEEREYHCDDIH